MNGCMDDWIHGGGQWPGWMDGGMDVRMDGWMVGGVRMENGSDGGEIDRSDTQCDGWITEMLE